MQKVAVYGTLKKGEGNHGLISQATLLETDVVQATHFQGNYWFPMGIFVSYNEDNHDVYNIAVEIYEVDKPTEARLDILEGVPSLYTKEYIKTKNGEDVLIYNYNWNLPKAFSSETQTNNCTKEGDVLSWSRK